MPDAERPAEFAPRRTWGDAGIDALCGAAGGAGALAVIVAILWWVAGIQQRLDEERNP